MNRPLRIHFRNEMLQHRNESISLQTRFWRWLCLNSFSRWSAGAHGRPIGVPGERDPLFPCTAYNPRPRVPEATPRCVYPDGHYLCERCTEHPQSRGALL